MIESIRHFFHHEIPGGLALCLSLFGAANGLNATLPTGENVVSGQAAFERTDDNLTVTQATRRAIVTWDEFSIGEGNLVQFIQPEDGAVLNRVVFEEGAELEMPGTSEILGHLEGNGRIFLINSHGIVFGPDAVVNAQSFLASTLDVSDEDFLQNEELLFNGESDAGIVNQGTLIATEGDVILIARSVDQDGTIRADEGAVGLAAGTEVLVSADLPFRVFVMPAPEEAESAQAMMAQTAAKLEAADGNPYALAINSDGISRATEVAREDGRTVLIPAPDPGEILHTGDIAAQNVTFDGQTGIRLQGNIEAGEILALRSEQGGITQTVPFQTEILLVTAGEDVDLFHEDNRLSSIGHTFIEEDGEEEVEEGEEVELPFMEDERFAHVRETRAGGFFHLFDNRDGRDAEARNLEIATPLNAGEEILIETTGRLVLTSGLSSGAEDDAIVIIAGEGLDNQAGSNALRTEEDGRWLVYARHPDDIRFGNLRRRGTEDYEVVRLEDGSFPEPEFTGNGFRFRVSREEARPEDAEDFEKFQRQSEFAALKNEAEWRPFTFRPGGDFPAVKVDIDARGWTLADPILARSSSFSLARETDDARPEENTDD